MTPEQRLVRQVIQVVLTDLEKSLEHHQPERGDSERLLFAKARVRDYAKYRRDRITDLLIEILAAEEPTP